MAAEHDPAAVPQRRFSSFRVVGVEPPPFAVAHAQPEPPARQDVVEVRLPFRPRVTAGISVTRKFRPDLGGLVSKIPIQRPAVPREKISGPLSPVPDPTDQTLFEDAANSQTKYYLPRYRVAEQTVSGQPQFRIHLDQQAPGGALTLFLEKFPAPTLGAAARQAAEIPHSIAVKLVARVPVGTSQVQQELVFQEIAKEGNLMKAVLRLDSLAQLTQVYQVLTEASFGASLVVLRSAGVAIPVPAANSAAVQQLTAQIQKLEQERTDLTKQMTALEAQRRQLLRLAPVNPAVRTRLQALQAQLRALTAQRNAKITEQAQKRAELAALQNQKLYRVTWLVLAWAVAPEPFVFSKDLHGYIFGNLVPPEGGRIGFVLHQASWKERSHTYYQQSLQTHRFHFLPDSFKVARKAETPHYPLLAVRFPNPDAAPETMPVTLEYVAEPYVDPERLEAAAEELKRKLPELANSGRQIEFEPLLCDTTRLFLTLPRGEAGPQREERKAAKVDLRTGILDAITLPMKDFQGVFDALFGASAVVLQGEVIVELDAGGGIPAEQIPVICRLADLSGDIFDVETQQDGPSGGVKTTLRNAIESPAQVRGLKAVLARGNATVEGVIQGLSFEAPLVIRPSEALTCLVAPAAPLAGTGDVTAWFDFDQVTVQPDSEAVWGAIADQTRLPELTRTIKVKTIRQTFEPKPDHPANPVVAIVVDFERGDSVDLSAEKLEADAKVRMSLADYVLRRLDAGEYRYKVTVIRVGGQSKDSDWRTERTGILFPPLPEAVAGLAQGDE